MVVPLWRVVAEEPLDELVVARLVQPLWLDEVVARVVEPLWRVVAEEPLDEPVARVVVPLWRVVADDPLVARVVVPLWRDEVVARVVVPLWRDEVVARVVVPLWRVAVEDEVVAREVEEEPVERVVCWDEDARLEEVARVCAYAKLVAKVMDRARTIAAVVLSVLMTISF